MKRRFDLVLPALLIGAVALSALALAGCSGNTARDQVLSPVIVGVWPAVKADALRGIAALENPAAADALHEPAVGPGTAQQMRDRVEEFDRALQVLRSPSQP